jgi:polyisoprenoid-binding protein YceI
MSVAVAEIIPTGTWNIDTGHSTVTFAVRHMEIAMYGGQFTDFEGTLVVADGEAVLSGSASVESVQSRNPKLDEHLVTEEFFDLDNHPELTFRSTKFEADADGTLHVAGDLEVKGISGTVELVGRYGGASTDPWGNDRIGISLTGALERADYELNWNQDMQSGGVVVGPEVHVEANLQAIRAPDEEAAG